jgi:DeoR/GlpR family transcriptional regulator of sugar metabolism
MSSLMPPIERRKHILDLIEKRNSISVGELCQLLGVSDMTIRRDLRSLSKAGLLERVYGGALLRRGRSFEPPICRMVENIEEETIGRRAAALVKDGDVRWMSAQPLSNSKHSALQSDGTTASVHIANVLNEHPPAIDPNGWHPA